MGLSSRQLFVLVLVTGVVVPGVLNSWLSQAGFGTLGSAVWAIGYGGMAVFIWFHWVRPLELTGASETDESVWETEDVTDTSE